MIPTTGSPLQTASRSGQEEAWPPRWLAALERAHALGHRAARALENAPPSEIDLGPAARALEEGLGAVYAAFDRRGDPLGATRTAASSIDAAVASLRPAAAQDPVLAEAILFLGEARQALAIAEERFARVAPELPQHEELRASQDVPALHRLERPSLAVSIRVAAPLPPPPEAPPRLPPPKDHAELEQRVADLRSRAEARREAALARRSQRELSRARRAPAPEPEPPRGFARGRFAALGDAEWVAARTRDCFEEVAMIGVQRAPLLGDPWRPSIVLERRMLQAIDGIAAIGAPALARIEPMVIDAPAKDASRAFAAAMILGCFDGRDALGAAERLLHHLGPADAEIARCFTAGLELVPHPSLPLALRTWLHDPDAAIRAMAVEVLAYRGWATLPELVAAAHDPSPLVVAAALPAIGLARAPELDAILAGALAGGDPGLREAAWTAMALAGHPRAADVLEDALAGPHASRAAVPLAVVGEEREAARLLEAMKAAPTSALVLAVGWAGSPEAFPALVDLLRHEDAALRLTAAYALDRITGAGLHEEALVPPEKLDAPEVPDADVGEPAPPPLARQVSDPRDLPADGSPDVVSQPTVRPDRWLAYWREHGPSYRPKARYRRGHPYTPMVSLWELDGWPLTPAERRILQRELVVRTGRHVRFDPHDFVSVQIEALKEWEPIARAASSAPGGWSRPSRR